MRPTKRIFFDVDAQEQQQARQTQAPAAAKSNLQDLLDVRKCLDLLDSRKTDEAKTICTAVLARAPTWSSPTTRADSSPCRKASSRKPNNTCARPLRPIPTMPNT
jgi:hypothetical protein